MKKIGSTLVILLTIIVQLSFAQNFTYTAPITQKHGIPNQLTEFYSEIHHYSTPVDSFLVIKDDSAISTNWYANICVGYICYPPWIDSVWAIIPMGGFDSILVDITPSASPPNDGWVTMSVQPKNHPELADSIRFHLFLGPMGIDTHPVNPPVIIPANGGSFPYNINVTNGLTTPQTFAIWNKVKTVGGQYYNVFGPITRALPGNANPTRTLTQTIASSIPAGQLLFISYLGTYPSTVLDSSYFGITKLTGSNGSPWITESYVSGDFFEEYANPDVRAQSASWRMPLQPTELALLGACPNPFNPTTAISYQLSALSFVNLSVYDVSGKKVAELVNGMRETGSHSVNFDASNLTSGIYVARLQAGSFEAVQKLVLMK